MLMLRLSVFCHQFLQTTNSICPFCNFGHQPHLIEKPRIRSKTFPSILRLCDVRFIQDLKPLVNAVTECYHVVACSLEAARINFSFQILGPSSLESFCPYYKSPCVYCMLFRPLSLKNFSFSQNLVKLKVNDFHYTVLCFTPIFAVISRRQTR